MPDEAPREDIQRRRRPLPLRILRLSAKVLLWVVGIVMGLLLLLWLALVIFFPDDKIRRILVGELSQRLQVPIQAGELDLSILRGLVLSDVVVSPPPGFQAAPLKFKRLVVDYSLADIWKKKLTVHRILIEEPEIVFEVTEAGNNLQALFGRASPSPARAEPQDEPVPEEDEGGLELDLEELMIEDAGITVRLPTLQISLADLDVRIQGRLAAPSATHLAVEVKLQAPAEPNVLLGEPPRRISAVLGFELQASLEGLDRLEGRGRIVLSPLTIGSWAPELIATFEANADLAAGRIDLPSLQLRSGGKDLLFASAGLEGIQDQGSRARLKLHWLNVPPQVLTDWQGLLIPDLGISGIVRLQDVIVEGSLTDPLPRVSAVLLLDSAEMIRPGLRLSGVTGTSRLTLEPGPEGGIVALDSTLRLSDGLLGTIALRKVDLRLQGRSQVRRVQADLSALEPSLGFQLRAGSIALGSLQVKEGALEGRIEAGSDPVRWTGDGLTIAEARTQVRIQSAGISAGVFSIESPSALLEMTLRDLSPAGSSAGSLNGKVSLRGRRLQLGENRCDSPRIDLSLKGGGISRQAMFRRPLEVDARIGTGSVTFPPVQADGFDGRLRVSLAGFSPRELPLQFEGQARNLILRRATGSPFVAGAVGATLEGVVSPASMQVALRSLELKLGDQQGDLLVFGATGTFDASESSGRAELSIRPFKLERLIPALPADLSRDLPKLSGEVEVSAVVAGSLAQGTEATPFTADTTLLLRGVNASIPAGDITGLSGQVQLRTEGPAFAAWRTTASLTVGKVAVKPAMHAAGVSLSLSASRELSETKLAGKVAAARLDSGGILPQPLTTTQIEFEGSLLGEKELNLNRISLLAPTLGLTLDWSGRVRRPASSEDWSAWGVSTKLDARLQTSGSAVALPGGLSVTGGASVGLEVESLSAGVYSLGGRITFDGFSAQRKGFAVRGMRGSIPVSQLLTVKPEVGLLAGRTGKADSVQSDRGRSSLYEDALLALKGTERAFSAESLDLADLAFQNLMANLELADGRLGLGSLRYTFLGGDVLADAQVTFAPPGTRRFQLNAELSGVDLAGLGALSLSGQSDISGNIRLGVDMNEKAVSATANLTQIGRSTLQALLLAMDPTESNPGVMEFRRFLQRFQVSPERVSLQVRHGLLEMEVQLEMGLAASAAARLIAGFEGSTFRLRHLPVSGLLSKVLGF